MTGNPTVKEIAGLEKEIAQWKARCRQLEEQVEFLRTHPSITRGLKGERLICKISDGFVTDYAERYDVRLANDIAIEVKYSALNTPVKTSRTRRWNWTRPLGCQDNAKTYDFLILLGEKNPRFPDQYLDDSPYVCFLVPWKHVPSIMAPNKRWGGQIALTSDLNSGWSEKSQILRQFLVQIGDLKSLLESVTKIESP